MSQAQQLYQLQILDSKIDKTQRELAEIIAKLGEDELLRQAKQTVEQAEQNLRRIQATAKDLELEAKGLNDKISHQEKLLYSGKALSAKEAANLQDEITSLKKWLGTREELLLEAMVETEDKEEQLNQVQQELVKIEAVWQAEQGDLSRRRAELEKAIATLQEQRPTAAGVIDTRTLTNYDTLRPKKAGVAVTGVKDNVCQSCGIMVSNSKIQRAKAGTELMYCGTCGRILYIF